VEPLQAQGDCLGRGGCPVAPSRARQSQAGDIVSLLSNHLRLTLPERAGPFARAPAPPPGVRTSEAPRLTFTAPTGAPAEELTLAYLRYIELHGRAVHHSKSGCSISMRRHGRSQTQVFGFWSRKAAEEFEWFWERYRLVYGHGDRGGQIAA